MLNWLAIGFLVWRFLADYEAGKPKKNEEDDEFGDYP